MLPRSTLIPTEGTAETGHQRTVLKDGAQREAWLKACLRQTKASQTNTSSADAAENWWFVPDRLNGSTGIAQQWK